MRKIIERIKAWLQRWLEIDVIEESMVETHTHFAKRLEENDKFLLSHCEDLQNVKKNLVGAFVELNKEVKKFKDRMLIVEEEVKEAKDAVYKTVWGAIDYGVHDKTFVCIACIHEGEAKVLTHRVMNPGSVRQFVEFVNHATGSRPIHDVLIDAPMGMGDMFKKEFGWKSQKLKPNRR